MRHTMSASAASSAATVVALVAFGVSMLSNRATASSQPNVLLLFVDDLGWYDLAAQGNTSLQGLTPNIDELRCGMRFTQWLSAASICTPSRAALMTGRLPVRYGMSTDDPNQRVLSRAAPGGIPHSEVTIAEVLRHEGYATGLVGKWHLGIGDGNRHLPTRHGFERYYGMPITNVQTCKPGKTIFVHSSIELFFLSKAYHGLLIALLCMLAMFKCMPIFRKRPELMRVGIALLSLGAYAGLYYMKTYTLLNDKMCLLYRGENIAQQPVNLFNMTQRLTADAQQFMAKSMEEGKPWFLMMSYLKMHTALFTNPEFRNKGGTAKAYGDNLVELDWSVGALVETLRSSGHLENTIILFTSDNGPFLERYEEGGSAGPLRGGKGTNWEGGIRVPGIAY